MVDLDKSIRVTAPTRHPTLPRLHGTLQPSQPSTQHDQSPTSHSDYTAYSASTAPTAPPASTAYTAPTAYTAAPYALSTTSRFIWSAQTLHRRDEAPRRNYEPPWHIELSPAPLRTPRLHHQPPKQRQQQTISQPIPRRLECTIQLCARQPQRTQQTTTSATTNFALSRTRAIPRGFQAIQRQDQGGTLD